MDARQGILIASLALLLPLVPSQVQASGVPSFSLDVPARERLVLSAVPFAVVDVIYFGLDRPLPRGLALLQIGLGGLLGPALTVVRSESVALSGVAVATGVWFVGHGVYSLISSSPGRGRRQLEPLRSHPRARLRLHPLAGGAALVVDGPLSL